MPEATPTLDLAREKRAIAIPLAVTLAFGCAFILWRWGSRGDWDDGALRCVTFACVMVAIHVWGYQAYRRQRVIGAEVVRQGPEPMPSDAEEPPVIVPGKRISWPAILAQQAFALLFGSIVLDGGELFRLFLVSVLVYWLAVLTCLITRHGRTTPADVMLLNIGFWPLAAFIALCAPLVWWLKGLL